ncbi:MAG TPA: ABC transporter permease [Gaiellaceae bacterium]|nr:ABC transporter permease [Gaiellaceae bacterium]HVN62698.1 ABC transporter permease [Gaiellaceae bacterium]
MAAFLVRRTIGAILVLVAVTFFVFVIFIVVPGGDPAERIAGKNATPQNIENIRHDWGFDRPFYVQYYKMMEKMATGSLVSYTSQQNVVQQIEQGMPATFSLSIGAGVIWLFFGILVGVISAISAGKFSDRAITVLALVGVSLPIFWLGIVTRYYLAEGGLTSFFPDGEYVPLTDNPAQWFFHLILPWTVLAVGFIGFYGRVLRGNVLDTSNEDYVRTAKAKGLPPKRIMRKHILRLSLIPIITLFGLDFAGVLGGGAILTETVFDLHGVGQYAAQSINNFDLPPIMGVTLYGAMFIVVFSVFVDLLYAYLDPRIRPT